MEAADAPGQGAPRLRTYVQALREALAQEMARDERVFVMGQGVDDHKGFYGTTLGLAEEFGAHRCFDLPLAEEGTTGVAVGAALAGMRPVHTHIRMDFLLLAMNQIVNIAAKNRYMYGGQVSVPLVIRAVIGRGWGQGAQHSQGLHALFMHIPGLRVVAPSTPYDAKGLLIRSIRDDNPVIFVEHRMLYGRQSHVPEESYTVPFGKARVLAEGGDLTIVGISHAVVEALRARHALAELGISAEVIDPVSLSPLDMATIAGSVLKTRRLLVVDTAWTFCGASAEIIAAVGETLSGRASFAFRRMGFAQVACPTSKPLENLFYPSPRTIAEQGLRLVRGGPLPAAALADAAGAIPSPEVAEFKGPF